MPMVNRRPNGYATGPLARYGVQRQFFANTYQGQRISNQTKVGMSAAKTKPAGVFSSGVPSGYAGPTEGSQPNPPTTAPPDTNPNVDILNADIDRQIALAKQQALANERSTLIGFGSQSLARKYLGNDPIIATISDDPNSQSTLGRLAYGYGQNQKSTNENMNAANLFYGGARNVALTQLAHKHTGDLFDQTSAVQKQLDFYEQQKQNLIASLIHQKIVNAMPPQS